MSNEPTAVSRPRPQLLLPGYQLVEIIGQGGMGEVHRAIQLSLDRTVAVKLLSANLAQDESFVARFEKEAATLAALSHPNIVSIVDKGSSGSTYFLVMEFVDGPSLREVMGKSGLDAPRALKIALDICRTIDYAHSRGVIHRDLKPENILFDQQAGNIPKVSDFGLASFMDGESRFKLTQTHMGMGTLAYMAPEQGTNAKNADHRADIYSLGVMLYELLVGELPLGTFEPPSRKKPGLDRRLDAIVSRCLKPAPADRYANVAELLAELEPLVPISSMLTQLPKPVSPVRKAWGQVRKVMRRAARVGEVVLVAGAVVVVLIVVLRVRYPGPLKLSMSEVLTLNDSAGALTPAGRVTNGPEGYRALVGEGPDALPLVTWGRDVSLEGGALSFAPMKLPLLSLSPPEPKASFGRLRLDLPEHDGDEVRASVDLAVRPTTPSAPGRLRDLVLGVTRESRGALVLAGEPGRYVALVMSGAEVPITFEWALQDRRGIMLGPPSPQSGAATLELSVDSHGNLRAFLGREADRRQVGEPVALGTGWKRYFGKLPAPSVACVEGECQARQLLLEVPAPAGSFEKNPPDESAVDPALSLAAPNAQHPPLVATTPRPGPLKPPAAPAVHPKVDPRAVAKPVVAVHPPAVAHKPVAKPPAPAYPVKKPVAPVNSRIPPKKH